jgi:hypothetical protein
MTPEAIRNLLIRVPFLPFRLHVSDQARYDILNPRMVMVGSSVIVIGINRDDPASEFFDEPVIVVNHHITRIEPLVELVDEVAT